jgi:hypothetical protein
MKLKKRPGPTGAVEPVKKKMQTVINIKVISLGSLEENF